MLPHSPNKDSFATIQGLLLYQCAPYLHRRGANVWIEEISRQHYIVGFTCWNDAERDQLWNWFHEYLQAALSERVYKGLIVKDRSGWRPPHPCTTAPERVPGT